MLQLISVVMVVYSYFLIRTSIPHLPHVIPTHFNAAGVADGWGSPDTLWVLLGAQALTTAVFLIVPYVGQRFPGAIHLGPRRLSDFPPAARTRVLPMLNNMAGYLSILMNLFFIFVLRKLIQGATEPVPELPMFWPMVLLVVGMFGIIFYYFDRFRRIAKGENGGGPPAP